ADHRPDRISVTAVDLLKADPFAFYAQSILKLSSIDPVDADHTARWKGEAVHQALQDWQEHDGCDPDKLRPRAERLLKDDAIHPLLRALWAPRLLEAIDLIAAPEAAQHAAGRQSARPGRRRAGRSPLKRRARPRSPACPCTAGSTASTGCPAGGWRSS